MFPSFQLYPCPAPGVCAAIRRGLAGDAVVLTLAMAMTITALTATPAQATPITSQELLEVRDLGGLAVSPDGRLAVVRVERPSVARNTIDLEWWVAPLDGAAPPYPVARGGDPIWIVQAPLQNEPPQWSPDSAWIYYRALVDGGVQLWRTRRDGGVSERLTDDPADVEAFKVDPEDGRVFYTAGMSREAILREEAEEYRSGVVVSGSVSGSGPIVNNVPYNGRMASMRHHAGGRSLLGGGEPRVRVLDPSDGEVRDASEAEVQRHAELDAPVQVASHSAVSQASVSAGSGRVAFMARLDTPPPASNPEEAVLSRLAAQPVYQLHWAESAEATRAVACEAAVCTGLGGQIGTVVWHPDGQEVLFAALGPDGSMETTLYGWDVGSGRVRTIFSGGFFGDQRMSIGDCPLAGDGMVCVTAAAASPPRLESIDLQTGARHTLLDPNPHLRDGRFGPVEEFTWKDAQGRGFHGYLLLPRDRPADRLPLVITTYNCAGFLRGGVGDEYPEHVFAAHGFAVLCYNHDTMDTSRTIQRGPDDEWLPVPGMKMATEALEMAIDLLDQRGLIDPERVGLSGLSYGARITLYAISHSPRFKAASTSSSSDLDRFVGYTALLRGQVSQGIRKLEGVPPYWDDPDDVLQLISPALNAARIEAPLLIQVADSEFGGDTIELMAHMKLAGKPMEVVVFPDETHAKWQPVHKLAAYDRNVDWFRFWLQGYEDADPAKRDRYERWRGFRSLQANP